MELHEGRYYRVAPHPAMGSWPNIGNLAEGQVVRLKGFVFRTGKSGRGWYACFVYNSKHGLVVEHVRVSNSHKGPNAFRELSALETLAASEELGDV